MPPYTLPGLVSAGAILVGTAWFHLRGAQPAEKPSQDVSCHDPFIDRATSVAPLFVIDVGIESEQWLDLRNALSAFARDRDWSFKDGSENEPGVVRTLYVSACGGPLIVYVLERRWASRDYQPPIPGRGVSVSIYGTSTTQEWQAVARDLVSRFEVKVARESAIPQCGRSIHLAARVLGLEVMKL